MNYEVSTAVAAARLGVSQSTVLNLLRAGRIVGRRGNQPRRPRWSVTVDVAGRPIGPDGTAFRAERATGEYLIEEPRSSPGIAAGTERSGTAREVALRLKAAGERQRRALELQAQAINELAAALDEQGEAIAQLLLPDTIAELTVEPTAGPGS